MYVLFLSHTVHGPELVQSRLAGILQKELSAKGAPKNERWDALSVSSGTCCQGGCQWDAGRKSARDQSSARATRGNETLFAKSVARVVLAHRCVRHANCDGCVT